MARDEAPDQGPPEKAQWGPRPPYFGIFPLITTVLNRDYSTLPVIVPTLLQSGGTQRLQGQARLSMPPSLPRR